MSDIDKFNVLIIEDEENLGDTLKDFLSSKGFICKWVNSVKETIEIFDNGFNPNIILMDIGLPDGDGISLARLLRTKRKDFVLIFLSALNDPETKFEALDLGAHDYITKPFDVRELILRLNRIMDNYKKAESHGDVIQICDLKIWFKRFEAQDADGKIIELSQKECSILEMLYSHRNDVVSREKIIEEIWGADSFPSNRTVDNYIVKLRKWIDTSKEGDVQIKTIRGIGYKLEYRGNYE